MSSRKLEVLAYDDTPLGLLCLRRRELIGRPGKVVTEITLDHEFLMSSYITDSERALASLALELHDGRELRVLVGGLGLGYTAHAALASPRVARAVVVEYLPQVITWLEQGLVPLSEELNADARLELRAGDVYAMLAAPAEERHDLILIDVDHSPDDHLGAGNAGFYTEAGLRAAQEHLAPGGILAVWSYAEQSTFTDALRAVFGEVRATPITVNNDLVDEEQTDWLFFARASF